MCVQDTPGSDVRTTVNEIYDTLAGQGRADLTKGNISAWESSLGLSDAIVQQPDSKAEESVQVLITRRLSHLEVRADKR